MTLRAKLAAAWSALRDLATHRPALAWGRVLTLGGIAFLALAMLSLYREARSALDWTATRSPLLVAEEVSSDGAPPPDRQWGVDSYTWTFYRFQTIRGSVTVRWLGESNGYYSESVDLYTEPTPIGDVWNRPLADIIGA